MKKKNRLQLWAANALSSFSSRAYFTLSYLKNRHRLPNFSHPSDLSEIGVNRILSGKINEIAYLADKYAVRDFVRSKGLEHILIPLISVSENASDLDFDKCPDRFALKMNYGAGMNVICRDKSALDKNKTREKVAQWLSDKHKYSLSESHYNLIPHKVLCEEFIDDGTGGLPVDYKFMCINGKAVCCLACGGRGTSDAYYLPYDLDWNPLRRYFKSCDPGIPLIQRPENLPQLIHTAQKLAENLDFVRVDLYSNGKDIWFGEMTLTPSGCIFHRWSNLAMDEMGAMLRHGACDR